MYRIAGTFGRNELASTGVNIKFDMADSVAGTLRAMS